MWLGLCPHSNRTLVLHTYQPLSQDSGLSPRLQTTNLYLLDLKGFSYNPVIKWFHTRHNGIENNVMYLAWPSYFIGKIMHLIKLWLYQNFDLKREKNHHLLFEKSLFAKPWNPFTQGCFMPSWPSEIEIGPVVLEKKIFNLK